jgi:hypothetical protein
LRGRTTQTGISTYSGNDGCDTRFRGPVLVCIHWIFIDALDYSDPSRYPVWMGIRLGYGFIFVALTTVFSIVFNYFVDAYREWSASAMAANTFSRCVIAGGFPLFAVPVCSLTYSLLIIDVQSTGA